MPHRIMGSHRNVVVRVGRQVFQMVFSSVDLHYARHFVTIGPFSPNPDPSCRVLNAVFQGFAIPLSKRHIIPTDIKV